MPFLVDPYTLCYCSRLDIALLAIALALALSTFSAASVGAALFKHGAGRSISLPPCYRSERSSPTAISIRNSSARP